VHAHAKHGITPLNVAAAYGNKETVKVLQDMGASVLGQNAAGHTVTATLR
jgi:ankyrin repeat protein